MLVGVMLEAVAGGAGVVEPRTASVMKWRGNEPLKGRERNMAESQTEYMGVDEYNCWVDERTSHG